MATVWSSSATALGESTNRGVIDPEILERRTREIGRELFERIGRGPKPWHRAWWDDRVMNWTLSDPQVRVQLFRFVDALPGPPVGRLGPQAPGGIPRRGRRACPLVAQDGGRPRPRRLGTRRNPGMVGADGRRSHGAEVHRRGHARPGHADRPQPAQEVAGLHGRPAGRGGHQRGRGRHLSADLPGPDPRPGRSARRPLRKFP